MKDALFPFFAILLVIAVAIGQKFTTEMEFL